MEVCYALIETLRNYAKVSINYKFNFTIKLYFITKIIIYADLDLDGGEFGEGVVKGKLFFFYSA